MACVACKELPVLPVLPARSCTTHRLDWETGKARVGQGRKVKGVISVYKHRHKSNLYGKYRVSYISFSRNVQGDLGWKCQHEIFQIFKIENAQHCKNWKIKLENTESLTEKYKGRRYLSFYIFFILTKHSTRRLTTRVAYFQDVQRTAFSLSVHLFSWMYLSSLIPFIP